MGRWGLALAVVLLLTGCTRVIDDARPRMVRPVAPIAAGQVEDLLSGHGRPSDESDLFLSVLPDACAALAQEVDAPFIFGAKPAATSGSDWDDDGEPSAGIVEVVGVYPADFDPKAAVEGARRAIESCQDDELKVTSSGGEKNDFRVRPRADSGSPQIVLWSLQDVGNWACDNAFVAAHNAAVEITTCAETNGYDVLTLAHGALTRIEVLADMTK